MTGRVIIWFVVAVWAAVALILNFLGILANPPDKPTSCLGTGL